ncbi:MAG: DUF1015 domain-containing protein [Candidatus Woesearchaeota archaeon]
MKNDKIGIKVDNILIPKQEIDLTKWAVIACDQYTSEEEYWNDVADFVKEDYSTLHLMLPEFYLESEDKKERIEKIHNNMNEYLEKNIFDEVKGIIYTERKLRDNQIRKGLVFPIDLEKYSYENDDCLIRPTEGTIVERIPPRKEIRNGAKIETPHVMVLVDDENKEIIEKINKDELEKVYDFDLMFDSGHLTGYKITDEDQIKNLFDKFECLIDKDYFENKYNVKDKMPVLFCVGDGNHSLATAKSYWNDIKQNLSDEEKEEHPARYALIELVNLYDESLQFEAIYKLLFDVDKEILYKEMVDYFKEEELEIKELNSFEEMQNLVEENDSNEKQYVGLIRNNEYKLLIFNKPKFNLSFATIQNFLDEFIEKHDIKIDYIHGVDSIKKLSEENNNCGFYFRSIQKSDLFKTVIKDNVLPRKTFSMGHAHDKRFYFECRKIQN